MSEPSLDRRFRGSVRLVTLHLWRIVQSTDLEEGFAAAREAGMFNAENEAFVRKCMQIDAQLEAGESPDVLDEPITPQMVHELQMCAIRLNSADPA